MHDKHGRAINGGTKLINERDRRTARIKMVEHYEGMCIAHVLVNRGSQPPYQIGITLEDFARLDCQWVVRNGVTNAD